MNSRLGSFELMLAVLFLSACSRSQESSSVASARPVQTVPVLISARMPPVDVSMVITQVEETELAFKVGGVIESVRVREGETVLKDQVLAELKLDEVDAQRIQAQSALAKAERDRERAQDLFAKKVMTWEQAQNADSALEMARAAAKAVDFIHRYSVIRAPSEGVILRRMAEPNQTVAVGIPVIRFAPKASQWIAHGGVAQADVARIAVGDRVQISASGLNRLTEGTVWRIAGAADSQTGSIDIEVLLKESAVDWRSGLTARALVFPRQGIPRPMIPASALIAGDGQRAMVFLSNEGIARRIEVTVESWVGNQVRLETALPAGADVVCVGAEFLRDGDSLRVMPVTLPTSGQASP